MEILNIDVGLKSYQLVEGGAPLIFNPGDPNIYARYKDAVEKIQKLEKEMTAKAKVADKNKDTEKTLDIVREMDQKAKKVLNGIFGEQNDFDAILCGVNLMAVTASGTRVIENLMNALNPIVVEGARICAEAELSGKMNREQRRASGV